MFVNARKCLAAMVGVVVSLAIVTGCDDNDKPNGPTVPAGLVAIHGLYYQGSMGDSVFNHPLELAVRDDGDNYLPGQQIQLSPIEGDGTLSARSAVTDSTGIARFSYLFSGSLGHAVIMATVGDKDTAYIELRANTLIPGDNGQGQYVLLDDSYADVLNFNGPPVSIDHVGWIAVANYEATLGVVVLIYDPDEDGVIDGSSPVYGVIVVDSVYPQPPDGVNMSARYEGKTADSIGIGSSYHRDILPVYGEADTIIYDNDPVLAAQVVAYDSLHLKFWCTVPDTVVFQMDLFEVIDTTLFGAGRMIPEWGMPHRRPAVGHLLKTR